MADRHSGVQAHTHIQKREGKKNKTSDASQAQQIQMRARTHTHNQRAGDAWSAGVIITVASPQNQGGLLLFGFLYNLYCRCIVSVFLNTRTRTHTHTQASIEQRDERRKRGRDRERACQPNGWPMLNLHMSTQRRRHTDAPTQNVYMQRSMRKQPEPKNTKKGEGGGWRAKHLTCRWRQEEDTQQS